MQKYWQYKRIFSLNEKSVFLNMVNLKTTFKKLKDDCSKNPFSNGVPSAKHV